MPKPLNLKQIATGVLCLVLPSFALRFVLRPLGHRINRGARIGFAYVGSDRIYMSAGSKIGHLNVVKVRRVVLRRNAYVGQMNYCSGPFSLLLRERAALGNRNVVTRARLGVSYRPAQLALGELSKITAGHKIDCTNSVLFGPFCTLAGTGSQIWTHGYVHTDSPPERYRVDGRVQLDRNVNIGSRSIITGGVSISDGIMVGAGTTVSKSLSEPGMYVSAALLRQPCPIDPVKRPEMERVTDPALMKTVYRKSDARS